MSIKEDRRINCDECLIVTDSDVKHLLDITIPYNNVGDILLKIARDMSNLYSFTDYQTYPRPSHPKLSKRLSPEFTFVAIITSLRCTLEIEQKVVNNLIDITQGSLEILNSIDIADFNILLKSAGMAKQKSQWIKEGLDKFSLNQKYSINALRQIPAEEARQRLIDLKGVGPKAADCFLLLGLDVPVFPVDVNVFKLVSKLFPEYITDHVGVVPSFSNSKHVNSVKLLLENSFAHDTKLYQILHTYLLLAEKYKKVTV